VENNVNFSVIQQLDKLIYTNLYSKTVFKMGTVEESLRTAQLGTIIVSPWILYLIIKYKLGQQY